MNRKSAPLLFVLALACSPRAEVDLLVARGRLIELSGDSPPQRRDIAVADGRKTGHPGCGATLPVTSEKSTPRAG